MNTKQITTLLALGQSSVDLHRADEAVRSARQAYHAAWRMFEHDGEEPDDWESAERVTQGHPRWNDAIEATAPAFGAYQAAKVAARKVKRRWVAACRRAAEVSNG